MVDEEKGIRAPSAPESTAKSDGNATTFPRLAKASLAEPKKHQKASNESTRINTNPWNDRIEALPDRTGSNGIERDRIRWVSIGASFDVSVKEDSGCGASERGRWNEDCHLPRNVSPLPPPSPPPSPPPPPSCGMSGGWNSFLLLLLLMLLPASVPALRHLSGRDKCRTDK